MHGYFKNLTPHIDIELYGALPDSKKQVSGLIDTGFNGYLVLPYIDAFPLGLVLQGVQSATLADGSISHNFFCLGHVVFDNQDIIIPIDIQPAGPILIGIQLLKKFEKNLHIDFLQEVVELKNRDGIK